MVSLLSVLLVLLCSVSFGEEIKASANHTEEELKQRYYEYYQYMIEKDVESLRSILREYYQPRHMTGCLQDGEEWLAYMPSWKVMIAAAKSYSPLILMRAMANRAF